MKKIIVLFWALFPALLFSQEENITFPSGNINMRGTLSIPSGDGPFPVVILVHGSGASDRDQTTPVAGANASCLFPQLIGETIKTFKDISDYLSANGIAVLRYEKRSYSHPMSIDPILGSPYDFVSDIESVLTYVKTRPEIDISCIVLAGHSQGSALIAAVQEGKEDVSGLISLAGAVAPIDSVITEQFRRLYTGCVGSAFCGNSIAAEAYTEFAKLRAGNDANALFSIDVPVCNFTFPLGYPTFWKDWIELGENVLINYNSFDKPMLIIQGEEDFNVPVIEAERFRNGLVSARTQINIFDGINHYLTPQDDPKVSAGILETMVDWIKNVKGSSSAKDISEADLGVKFFQNKNSLNIEVLNKNSTFDQVQIADMSGRVLIKKELSNQQQIEIPFFFSSGVVIVSLFSKGRPIFSKKVMFK